MTISIRTHRQVEMVNITQQVRDFVAQSGVGDGLCLVYVPHTTAGVTVNEGADPDVMTDLIAALDRMVPEAAAYRHGEGNSPAHVKASLMGATATLIIEGGQLRLGTWQAVFFTEFDGPRTREAFLKVVPG